MSTLALRQETIRQERHWLRTWTPDDVQHAEDKPRAFASYAQQVLGTPFPTAKQLAVLRKRTKEFLEQYPQADWRTLCRVVIWCRQRRRRPGQVHYVLDEVRRAWASGALPELDPRDRVEDDVEASITAALERETREEWRRALLGARGVDARRKVLQAWRDDG